MPSLIQDFVTESTQQFSEHIAIAWKDEAIPYLELDRLTNQLAHLLEAVGCEKGDRVAFLIPKSPNAIFVMLGALKADCVYVPINTNWPTAVIAKVLESCEPKVVIAASAAKNMLDEVLASEALADAILVGTVEAVSFDGEHFETAFTGLDVLSQPTHARDYENSSQDAAQILFDGDSIENLQGVVVSHDNVTALVEWAKHYFQMDQYDRISGHAPTHSSLATFDVFGAFAVGAELHPVPSEICSLPNKLAEFIRTRELTQWFSGSEILNDFVKWDSVRDGDFESLKRLIWNGEGLRTSTLMFLMERLPVIQFTHLYGSTETTVVAGYHSIVMCPERDTDAIPIGRPRDGVELFVFNARLLPVARGEVGELYVGGDGLSPGYWKGQTQATANFFKHPVTGQRLFKTGDVAQVGDDGLMRLVNRNEQHSASTEQVSQLFQRTVRS